MVLSEDPVAIKKFWDIRSMRSMSTINMKSKIYSIAHFIAGD